MVNGCVIIGCSNGALKGKYSDKNVSMHAFPLDDNELCGKWVKAIRRQNFVPSKHSRLCSSHFQPSDLIEHSADTNVSRQRQHKDRKLAKRYLRKGAIPTIFPETPSSTTVFNHRPTKYEFDIADNSDSYKHDSESSPRSDTHSSYYIVEQEIYQEDDGDIPTDLSMKSMIIKQEYPDEQMNEYNISTISFPSNDPELEHWMQTEPLDLSINKSHTH